MKVDISSIISGLVPDARTINGKNLKADITLSASDVGAYAKDETFNKSEVTNLLGNQKQELLVGIEEHQVVGYAYSSTEAEKASGYTKGGGIDKALKAVNKCGYNTLTISGGVAANGYLRETLQSAVKNRGIKLVLPEKRYCTDNGAMIAAEGYLQYKKRHFADLDLNASAVVPLK